ncbi:MAG: ATPase P, partial [Clostridia bacterium]|nr:ATPase P [Clostridia bacterium]
MAQITPVRKMQEVRTDAFFRGLTQAEADAARIKYGSNRLSRRKPPGFLTRFFRNLNDPIIRILIGALVLNILFLFPDVDWYECGGIAFAVFVSAFVSTVSEYSSGKAFASLYDRLGDTGYDVLRDGQYTRVGIGDLVCMDTVRLRPGDMVPADGYLLSGELQLDEASLTGESHPVRKTGKKFPADAYTPDNLPEPELQDASAVFRGSAVCSGEGIVLLRRVGDATLYGQIASQLQEEELPSPLKERLTKLAGIISKIGYVSAAFVALAHLFHAFYMESGMNLSVMWTRMQ